MDFTETLPLPPQTRPNNVTSTLLGTIGWLVVLPLLLLSVLRLFHLDSSTIIVEFETLTPLLYLPAYAVLLAALARRRWLMAGFSAAVVGFHILFVAPQILERRPLAAGITAPTAAHLRLFTHNVQFDNPNPERLAGSIHRANPDLVFLQELSSKDLDALEQSHVLNDYPFQYRTHELGVNGIGVWSKTPLDEMEAVKTPGFPILRGETTINGQRLRFYNVHIIAPVGGFTNAWQSTLQQLNHEIHMESEPVVVAGDFNSVYDHRPYRNLLTRGFHDAHIDRGRPFARTWPANGRVSGKIGGFVRLDHVITGPGVQTTKIQEGPGDGSDHRCVIADIAFTG